VAVVIDLIAGVDFQSRNLPATLHRKLRSRLDFPFQTRLSLLKSARILLICGYLNSGIPVENGSVVIRLYSYPACYVAGL